MRNPVIFPRIHWGIFVIVCACFALSLISNAVYFHNGTSLRGITMLVEGWAGPWNFLFNNGNGRPYFGWYGNPFLLISIFMFGLGIYKVSAAFGSVGLVLASDSFRLVDGASLNLNGPGGNWFYFHSWGPAFYLWLLSFILLVSGSIGLLILRNFKGTLHGPDRHK